MYLLLTITILINDDFNAREDMLDYAATLLSIFVDNTHIYYGDIFNVYSAHNLIHNVDDVKHFNFSLDSLSCFKFDNYLQSLERMAKMQVIPFFRYINGFMNWRPMNSGIRN